MNNLKDQISEDIKSAMKARDKVRLNVLRYLKKLFIENDTSAKSIPELDIIVGHQKKIKESIDMYPEGSELRTQAEAELEVVNEYLPKPLTETEVVALIEDIKSNLDNINMGAIMKELTPRIKGRFDGKKASELVKSNL
ncbi:MAG: hypothetical protein CME65_13020 [Halobacteriovoraceae bacterium]|nr:hypothetical protein [Halobacteriovoraceae bacterium]|tara:strand:- start:6908 stop:7324 length:417 start_codon:yes stop_codon:yes gene_type:complete